MAATQAAILDNEAAISAEVVGLTDFAPQALAHVVAGAQFEHRRLPGGGPNMHLLQCCLPHSVINRGIYSPAVLVTGTFASDAVTLGLMLRQQEPTILNGDEVRMGTVQFYPENAEMCYRAWPDATWMTFVLSRERLLQFCLDHLDEAPDLPKSGIMTIEPESEQSAGRFLDSLRDLGRSLHALGSHRNRARLGELVENDLLARVANLICARPLVRSNADRHRLRLCIEILRDTIALVEQNPTEILDLQSMSQATGLSPRTLQRTFQAEYGLCPQEWLRVERLHRVREDLLNAKSGNSVTDIATRWGFFHLGRFSQYYRDLFGEQPSQTLARHAAINTLNRW